VQCGICWRGSVFGQCYDVFFPVFFQDNPSQSIEAADAILHKKRAACKNVNDVITDPDTIEIIFHENFTPEDKFSLICVGLCIDFRFYEQNPFEVQSEVGLEG
jgi:hypothetical protein